MSPAINRTRKSARQRGRPSAGAARTRPAARRAGTLHGQWFSALGDRTRLALITRLSRGERCSIAQLTHGSHLTRQAITKHLRVLERAQLVRSIRSGRKTLFELDPAPMHAMRDYIDQVSAQWDQALSRLQALVEKGAPSHSRRRRPGRR